MNIDIDTTVPETSGTRAPSPRFLKGRHERMRNRLNNCHSPREDEAEGQGEATQAFEVTLNNENTDTNSTGQVTGVRSIRQLREKRRNRVPGGAAAKLIGKIYNEDVEGDIDNINTTTKPVEDEEDPPEVLDDFVKIRDEAKDAFEKGTKDNRRYHQSKATSATTSHQIQMQLDRRENRRVLNREEILHDTPAASVLALLNGSEAFNASLSTHNNRFPDGIPTISSSRSREQSMIPPPPKDFTQTPAIDVVPRNAFQAPPRKDEHPTTVHNENAPSKPPSSIVPDDMETTTKGKNPLEQPLLSKKAEQRVAQMKEQMHDPSSTLADLIGIISTPEDKTFSRGYMVRRKNACGALQVLAAKINNRVKICWTLGVLPALSSVLEDSGSQDSTLEFPDVHTRNEFIEARKRAVNSLVNLSLPPKNRLAVFHTPRMVSNIVRVIKLDQYEARQGCCAVLAHLAKSKENRLLMVQIPELVDTVISIIEPNVIIVSPKPIESDEEDDDDSSASTPEQEFALRNSSSTGDDGSATTASDATTSNEIFNSQSATSVENHRKEKQYKTTRSKVDTNAIPMHDPATAAKRYDSDPNKYLHGARLNCFALLSHLVKEKDNSYILARHKYLVHTLVEISKLHDSPAHEYAVKMLAHMTRHRGNTKHMVFKLRKVVPVLVKAALSQNDESRRHACFALQNMAQDKPCRQELAITDDLLTALCVRIRQASDPVERLSAIHALKNLTDEPANLIPMTNTPECFATLMQIAHAGDDSVTDTMQFLACDALATLSHWFRSIATSGHRIELAKQGLTPATTQELFVPSLRIVPYLQWQ